MKAFLKTLTLIAGASMMMTSCNAGYKQFLEDNFAKGKVSDALLKEATPGAAALISCCLYYEAELEKGAAEGQKWFTPTRANTPRRTVLSTTWSSPAIGE